jgi:hypothetical protein
MYVVKKKDEQANEAAALSPVPEPVVEPVIEPVVAAYTKAQYLTSNRFTFAQKDILAAVLVDGETYTADAVNRAIEAYLKRSVK